jgi:phosphatidate phosphatase APP1
MTKSVGNSRIKIQLYDGYGHSDRLFVFGHVFKWIASPKNRYTGNMWHNAVDMLRLFLQRPYPGIKIRLHWQNQVLETITESDGLFRFEWDSERVLDAGWHTVRVVAFSRAGEEMKSEEGQVYVPHETQFGIVSDIDDTIMVSHSARFMKRMREIFIRNSHSRKLFPATARFYYFLSEADTNASMPNPFFYVSSSEWNLYAYLQEFFQFNGLPKGIFLLNRIKRWYDLLKTGETNHAGKGDRIRHIFQTFPNQKFVLLGDNSQADPLIYGLIAKQFPAQIVAILIRNVRPSRELHATKLLSQISQKGIHTCLYAHSDEAISFSVKIGLLNPSALTSPTTNVA